MKGSLYIGIKVHYFVKAWHDGGYDHEAVVGGWVAFKARVSSYPICFAKHELMYDVRFGFAIRIAAAMELLYYIAY